MAITTGGVNPEPGSSTAYKTGSWRSMRPVRDPAKCKRCWKCYIYCPDSAVVKVKEWVFSLPLDMKGAVSGGTVGDELKAAFKEHKFNLSSNAQVSGGEGGSWEIDDGTRKYWLEEAEGEIAVFALSPNIDYDFCKGCGICAAECKFGAIEMVEEEK